MVAFLAGATCHEMGFGADLNRPARQPPSAAQAARTRRAEPTAVRRLIKSLNSVTFTEVTE
jgi:hypothetical protein